MVGKKAYIRTLEVMIAMVLTFAFVLYLMPSPTNVDESGEGDILLGMIDNDGFRNAAMSLNTCVGKGDNVTMNSFIDSALPAHMNYAVCPEGTMPTLPREKVNAESVYLTGNITDFDNGKVVRLYYWE